MGGGGLWRLLSVCGVGRDEPDLRHGNIWTTWKYLAESFEPARTSLSTTNP